MLLNRIEQISPQEGLLSIPISTIQRLPFFNMI